MKTIVALMLALALLVGCAPAAKAESGQMVVMTLNIHGGSDRDGGGNHGSTKVSTDILQVVSAQQPTVIALQEICGKQYRDLKKKLGGYSGTFTNTKRQAHCHDKKHGNLSGIAIFIKGEIQTRYVWQLPWGANAKGVTGRQPRSLLCVKPVGQSWRACVTHLSPHAPDVLNQTDKVRSSISRWAGKVVVAGDFNLSTKWVDRSFPSYFSVGDGIDHVVSTSAVTVKVVVPVKSSDHPALIATIN